MKDWGKYIVICLLAFAGITCKKDVPVQPGGGSSTVFSVSGTVTEEGIPTPINVSYIAGENNYYMFSSYRQATDSLYSYIGSLHLTSNANDTGKNSIEFTINDYRKIGIGAVETNINTALAGGGYSYKDSANTINSGAFYVQYTPEVLPDSVLSYNWHFGDGGTSDTATPLHRFASPGKYATILNVVYAGPHSAPAVTDTVGQVLQVVVTDSIPSPLLHPDSVEFYTTVGGGSGPYTYAWNFGDSHTGFNAITGHNYNPPGLYTATLTVKDAANHSNTQLVNVDPGDTSHTNYYANFTTTTIPDTATVNAALSDVTIKYTDNNGYVFSSSYLGPQPPASHSTFQITNVSSYGTNENGETTKMLHITFNCMLKNIGPSGPKYATITNGQATIAVAYK